MKRKLIVALGLGLALLAVPAFGQDIHELYYNNAYWADTDLTVLTGGPSATASFTAFHTTPNDQLHVYYASLPYGDVHQLYNNGSSWTDEDLTLITGGQTVGPGQMSGFSIGNAQYIYFCGSDNAVHEYSYGDSGNWNWVDARLPMANQSDVCGTAVGLVAFATKPNNQRHVYYKSGLNNAAPIHQLYFNGWTWSNENLTQEIKGAKPALSGGWISGFANGNFQYVYFQSPSGHVHEYSYVNNWVDTDLTVVAGGVVSDTATINGTAAFLVPGTTQREVYYSAASTRDVHRMTFQKTKWTDTNLSQVTGGAGPTEYSQMVGFATQGNDQLHIYLISGTGYVGYVDQLYYNNKAWSYEPLPSVQTAEAMAGFAVGNLQHVYYVSY